MIHEKTQNIFFVDMEYGSYNYRGFDIANHFCEFSGFDYAYIDEKYPNKAQQYNFIQAYLEVTIGKLGSTE